MRARTKNLHRIWIVRLGNRTYHIVARTRGAAARGAFKRFIRRGITKRQPPSDENGGWRGVEIWRKWRVDDPDRPPTPR